MYVPSAVMVLVLPNITIYAIDIIINLHSRSITELMIDTKVPSRSKLHLHMLAILTVLTIDRYVEIDVKTILALIREHRQQPL